MPLFSFWAQTKAPWKALPPVSVGLGLDQSWIDTQGLTIKGSSETSHPSHH